MMSVMIWMVITMLMMTMCRMMSLMRWMVMRMVIMGRVTMIIMMMVVKNDYDHGDDVDSVDDVM